MSLEKERLASFFSPNGSEYWTRRVFVRHAKDMHLYLLRCKRARNSFSRFSQKKRKEKKIAFHRRLFFQSWPAGSLVLYVPFNAAREKNFSLFFF